MSIMAINNFKGNMAKEPKAPPKLNLKLNKGEVSKTDFVPYRPREYNREEVMTIMIEWCKVDGNDSLLQFSADTGILPSSIFTWCDEEPSFQKVYEQAKMILAAKREKRMDRGKMAQCVYNKTHHVYDTYAKKEDRDRLKFESDLKKEEAKVLPENMIQAYEGVMAVMTAEQDKRREYIKSLPDDRTDSDTEE